MLWWEVVWVKSRAVWSGATSFLNHGGVEVEVEWRVAHHEVVDLVRPLGIWIKCKGHVMSWRKRWNPPVCRNVTTFSSAGSPLLTSVKSVPTTRLWIHRTSCLAPSFVFLIGLSLFRGLEWIIKDKPISGLWVCPSTEKISAEFSTLNDTNAALETCIRVFISPEGLVERNSDVTIQNERKDIKKEATGGDRSFSVPCESHRRR